MPDSALRDLVLKRLEASTQPEDAWSALVLAALGGQAELQGVLDSGPTPGTQAAAPTASKTGRLPAATAGPAAASPQTKPATGSYLRSITVEGFRGIGPAATLAIEPGPGLTLLVGCDLRFWRVAPALTAPYPADTDDHRWVDGTLARKKGLGL